MEDDTIKQVLYVPAEMTANNCWKCFLGREDIICSSLAQWYQLSKNFFYEKIINCVADKTSNPVIRPGCIILPAKLFDQKLQANLPICSNRYVREFWLQLTAYINYSGFNVELVSELTQYQLYSLTSGAKHGTICSGSLSKNSHNK